MKVIFMIIVSLHVLNCHGNNAKKKGSNSKNKKRKLYDAIYIIIFENPFKKMHVFMIITLLQLFHSQEDCAKK